MPSTTCAKLNGKLHKLWPKSQCAHSQFWILLPYTQPCHLMVSKCRPKIIITEQRQYGIWRCVGREGKGDKYGPNYNRFPLYGCKVGIFPLLETHRLLACQTDCPATCISARPSQISNSRKELAQAQYVCLLYSLQLKCNIWIMHIRTHLHCLSSPFQCSLSLSMSNLAIHFQWL